LSCLLAIWISLVLLRNLTALLTFLLGTLGLLSFFYVKFFGDLRHHGFLFMLFIVAVWILRYGEEERGFAAMHGLSRMAGRLLGPILTFILTLHFVGGIIAVSMDNRYVFSNSKATAAFIKERNLQEMLMVGEADAAVSTIVGYLGKKQIYYPRGERFGSFVIWDKARNDEVSDEQTIQKAVELGENQGRDVLMILNHFLTADLISRHSLTELGSFTGSVVRDEGFYLYLIEFRRNR
jgi:hypothetical protein